jgi:hypothetical protein
MGHHLRGGSRHSHLVEHGVVRRVYLVPAVHVPGAEEGPGGRRLHQTHLVGARMRTQQLEYIDRCKKTIQSYIVPDIAVMWLTVESVM